jgi:hypothetical protein
MIYTVNGAMLMKLIIFYVVNIQNVSIFNMIYEPIDLWLAFYITISLKTELRNYGLGRQCTNQPSHASVYLIHSLSNKPCIDIQP